LSAEDKQRQNREAAVIDKQVDEVMSPSLAAVQKDPNGAAAMYFRFLAGRGLTSDADAVVRPVRAALAAYEKAPEARKAVRLKGLADKLVTGCNAVRERLERRPGNEESIDALNKLAASIQEVARDPDRLRALVTEYYECVGRMADDSHVRGVNDFLQSLQTVEGDERTRLLAGLKQELADAFGAARNALKDRMSVDATNVWGMARAYWTIKDYKNAMKHFTELEVAATPETFGEAYWEMELELCQCFYEGFKGDKAQMRRLADHIRRLQGIESGDVPPGERMGKKLPLFNKILYDAGQAGGR
jgi:hypothetical protein